MAELKMPQHHSLVPWLPLREGTSSAVACRGRRRARQPLLLTGRHWEPALRSPSHGGKVGSGLQGWAHPLQPLQVNIPG